MEGLQTTIEASKVTVIAPNAVQLLMQQHREVEDLFSQFESVGEEDTKTKKKIFDVLAQKVLLHAQLEEKFFYPRLESIDEDGALEAHEEHALVKELIQKTLKIKSSNDTFDAKVKVLKELIEHHVKEEEQELLPKWQSETSAEELEDLGAKMQAAVDRKEMSMERSPKRSASTRNKVKSKAKNRGRKKATRH